MFSIVQYSQYGNIFKIGELDENGSYCVVSSRDEKLIRRQDWNVEYEALMSDLARNQSI